MNYDKYIKKKGRLIDVISQAFKENMNLSNNFIIECNFSERYKDEVLSIYLNNEDYKLIFLIYLDLIKLDIEKTKFEYFFYKNRNNNFEFFNKGNTNYNELIGKNFNEKINSLIKIILNF